MKKNQYANLKSLLQRIGDTVAARGSQESNELKNMPMCFCCYVSHSTMGAVECSFMFTVTMRELYV